MNRCIVLVAAASITIITACRPVQPLPTVSSSTPLPQGTPASEQATPAEGSNNREAAPLTPEDVALFQKATFDSLVPLFTAIQQTCPEVMMPEGRLYPLAEPNYTAKRPLDLSSFASALEAFTPERAVELDQLLIGKTIPQLQDLLNDNALTSVELVTYYIDRIKRYDVNALNSVLELNPNALQIAADLDAQRAAGNATGPLHGIPILLKDNIAAAGGMHTTAGAYALKDWQPDRDAFLVTQLRNAGAIILGKANLSEWANYMDPCMPSGFSTLGGQTRHPYGPYDPMGSSSGSAVAVAANLATASMGSETSGSIIQPARVNSIVALRPSLGLISRDYIIPLADDLDTPGPMGRSVTDVALMLTVMASTDENDPASAGASSLAGTDFTRFLSLEEARKLRVGVLLPVNAVNQALAGQKQMLEALRGRPLSEEEIDAIVAEVILPQIGGDPEVAIKALESLGIETVLISDETIPAYDTARPLLERGFLESTNRFFALLGESAPVPDLNAVIAINNEDPANRAPYGNRFLEWSAATTLTSEAYDRVLAVSQSMAQDWMAQVLDANNIDILVSGISYTSNAGAAGIPALTIPAGLDPTGKPQGVILTGSYLSEPKLLAVGYALEQALQGRVEPDLNSTLQQIKEVTGQ